jgi:hypothetical protein
MRPVPIAVLVLALAAILAPAQAANFGAHAGVANGVFVDPYFRAGALLADVDHWLSPSEPRTDTPAFAQGLQQRAWLGSRNAWRFVNGWYDHLDADVRFTDSAARILAAYPAYTVTDVRLAFDYWTLAKHPFPTDYEWVLADAEVLALVQGGLFATDLAGVRAAVDQLLHSTNLSAPGLALQLDAARLYGILNPTRVAAMEAEFDRFWSAATARFVPPLPRLDISLRAMAAILSRHAANPLAAMPFLRTAMSLEALRPAGWMAQEGATLAAFIDALFAAGLPPFVRQNLEDRAEAVIDYLT